MPGLGVRSHALGAILCVACKGEYFWKLEPGGGSWKSKLNLQLREANMYFCAWKKEKKSLARSKVFQLNDYISRSKQTVYFCFVAVRGTAPSTVEGAVCFAPVVPKK